MGLPGQSKRLGPTSFFVHCALEQKSLKESANWLRAMSRETTMKQSKVVGVALFSAANILNTSLAQKWTPADAPSTNWIYVACSADVSV